MGSAGGCKTKGKEREERKKDERSEGQGERDKDTEGRENRERPRDYRCAQPLRPAAVAKAVLRLHSLFIRRVARCGVALMKGVY